MPGNGPWHQGILANDPIPTAAVAVLSSGLALNFSQGCGPSIIYPTPPGGKYYRKSAIRRPDADPSMPPSPPLEMSCPARQTRRGRLSCRKSVRGAVVKPVIGPVGSRRVGKFMIPTTNATDSVAAFISLRVISSRLSTPPLGSVVSQPSR
ncbi:hypothetical protein VTI74DRAFT_6238 [Chaetomium olivicolor]